SVVCTVRTTRYGTKVNSVHWYRSFVGEDSIENDLNADVVFVALEHHLGSYKKINAGEARHGPSNIQSREKEKEGEEEVEEKGEPGHLALLSRSRFVTTGFLALRG
ncbi:hypothetical protein BHE74_00045931, partial [Ensete ventricosum]